MTDFNVFCAAKEYSDENSYQQKDYRAFNKVVGEERYFEILKLIKSDILKGFSLTGEGGWKNVKAEQWSRLRDEVPEYNEVVVEMVTGFKPEYVEEDNVNDQIIESLKDIIKKLQVKK